MKRINHIEVVQTKTWIQNDFKYLNHLIGYMVILLVCVNAFVKNDDQFDFGFQFRGLFWLILLILLYGFFISKHFREVLKRKLSIFLFAYFFVYILYSFYFGNEYYWIKSDVYSILHLLLGILVPFLISYSKNRVSSNYIYIVFFFTLIAYYFSISQSGDFYIDKRYSGYTTAFFSQLLLPVLFVCLSMRKISNKSRIKYYLILSIITFLSAFIGGFRSDLVAVFAGSIFIINLKLRNSSMMTSIFKNMLSIICIVFIILAIIPFFDFLERPGSDEYRILEATYVFDQIISKNLFFGKGLGTYFFSPKGGDIALEVHLGLFTLLLKFGMVGVFFLLLIFFRIYFKYFIHSRSKKRFFNEPVILLAPSLAVWLVYLMLAKGTFPESLFGLGLSIGLYLNFRRLEINNNLPAKPEACKYAPIATPA